MLHTVVHKIPRVLPIYSEKFVGDKLSSINPETDKVLEKKDFIMMEYHNKSCEPMDIDLSANSVHEMDISYNESVSDTKTFIKREKLCSTPVPLIDLTAEPEEVTPISKFENLKKYRSECSPKNLIYKQCKVTTTPTRMKILLSIIFTVCLSIFTYHIFSIRCSDLNLDQLRVTLSKKVYGQTEALLAIAEILEAKVESKIILFSGGTGVGKTYAASLILENTGYSSNIYHYTMPSFVNTFTTDLMLGLTFCKTSLVIVDDLNIDDLQAKSHIEDIILKSKILEKNITIILIYNCDNTGGSFIRKCDDNFHSQVLDKYKNVRGLKKLIQFKPLTEECLMKCIEHELGDRKMDKQERNRVLKNFNVSLNGCKGVHTKMKFLNIL